MKILITDKPIKWSKGKFDQIYIFNNRNKYPSKKIFSILNLLESEKVLTKNELNNITNAYLKSILKNNRKIFKNHEEVILYSLFSDKNIFIDSFYFKYYQFIIFDRLFKKTKFNKNITFDVQDKTLNYFLKDCFFSNKLSRLLHNLKSFVKGVRFHALNNLIIFKKKTSMINFDNLFVDDYNSFDDNLNSSKIWHKIIQKFQFDSYIQLAVNSSSLKQNKKVFKEYLKLDDYKNIFIFLKTLGSYFKIYFKLIFLFKNYNNKNNQLKFLYLYLKYNYQHSNLVKSINDYYLFEYFFAINKFKRIFIISENQSWEKILIYHSNSLNITNNIISYVHTPIRYWDLRYDSNLFTHFKKFHFPKYICVSTVQCIRNYNKIIKQIKIRPVEAIRYLYLKNHLVKKIKLNSYNKSYVVVGDINPNSTSNLLSLLNIFAKKRQLKLNILVKFHPLNILPVQKYNFLNIKSYSEKNINQNIYLFPNYTTASIDFNYQNKICLSFIDKNNFNLSPLLIFKKYYLFFDDVDTFENILNFCTSNEVNEKYKFYFANNFFNWKKLINETQL